MTALRQAYVGGKEWFSQSGLPDDRMSTPRTYAYRLTRYISDPSTVRARTVDAFGAAPGIEVIRKMRSDWVDLVKRRAQEQAEHGCVIEAAPLPEPIPAPERTPEPIEPEPELKSVAARGYMLHTATDVIDACADACGISHGELIGTSRQVKFTRARGLCATVLRARGNSLPNVGRLMNGRDHSTVCNSIDRFFARDIKVPELEAAWNALAPCVLKACRSGLELTAMAAVRK